MAQIANEAMLVITKLNYELSSIEVFASMCQHIPIYSFANNVKQLPLIEKLRKKS